MGDGAFTLVTNQIAGVKCPRMIEAISLSDEVFAAPLSGCAPLPEESPESLQMSAALFESQDSGWDRTLLDLASKCAEPICWAYGVGYRLVTPLNPSQFNNCDNVIQEIAIRTLSAIGALAVVPFALPLGIAHKICRAAGFFLQKDGYTHVRGSAPEITLAGSCKVMTWNVCGIGGGMHYDHGGVISWQDRFDSMVDLIRRENPDVLVLQEIYDTALAEALIENLQDLYPHFFCHLGANTMGSVGGLMVLSKCAIHSFTNTSFTNNDWTLNRTFATLEIKARPEDTAPCARIIGTHLIHNNNDARREQLDEILTSLQNTVPLPTVLMGDLNLERDNPEEGGMLAPYFEQGYQGREPTCTNRMLAQWNAQHTEHPDECIDYISRYLPSGGTLQDVRLVRAFSPDFNTKTALSDHQGLTADFRFANMIR